MMSADPTAEHIDAGSGVRFALNDVLDVIAADFVVRDGEPMSDIERETLAFILTSTDPAVHAALAASLPAEVMLAALVDRGALTAEDEVEWCDVRCPVWSISSDARCSHSCRRSGPHDEHECVDGHTFPYDRFDGPKPTRSRRFVTPWEVAP